MPGDIEASIADVHRLLARNSRQGGAVGGRNGSGRKGGIEDRV